MTDFDDSVHRATSALRRLAPHLIDMAARLVVYEAECITALAAGQLPPSLEVWIEDQP